MTEILSKEELENDEDLPLELGDLRVEEKLEIRIESYLTFEFTFYRK